MTETQSSNKEYKVAFICICLNPLYWEYIQRMLATADKFFLKNHNVDYLLWTDLPENLDEAKEPLANAMAHRYDNEPMFKFRDGENEKTPDSLKALLKQKNETIDKLKELQQKVDSEVILGDLKLFLDRTSIEMIPTEPIEWPHPTLMRYHLFLNEEERLSEYDYIFYCDIDMLFVADVGDEILGDGITAAQHPMYAFRQGIQFPLEPNPESSAYINVPQKYYAGGFQGGKAKDFIEAMKVLKANIDKDFNKNYTARWNDESHWNRYLFDNPPVITLSPSYVYPDSLIKEYYEPLWGCNYEPKLITLTKKFTTSSEGGQQAGDLITGLNALRR